METYGIIGYGFVGKATHKGLISNTNAAIHDLKLNTKIDVLKDADVVFCCVPTDNQQDIEKLINELENLRIINKTCTMVIRSTVPVGTCEKIEEKIGPIIYIPEFLRERYWETDCMRRPVIVGTNTAELPEFLNNIEKSVCSLNEAELLKMFSNNYATLRIAFANILYDLAEVRDADYNLVKDLFFKVQHSQTYMEVPGHDGKRGFGGKCLPKDLDFLIDTLDEFNLDSRLFQYIRENNTVWNNKKY